MNLKDDNQFFSGLYGQLQSEGSHGWYIKRSHKALERTPFDIAPNAKVLELGANLGEHLPYVKDNFSSYVLTDYRNTGFKTTNTKVSFAVVDAQDLSFRDEGFDRVLMTCVLHHLSDPERCLREIRRVTKRNGLVSFTLPCDPGIAYRAAKFIGPYRHVSRQITQSDPRYLHYRQHKNHYPGLYSLVEEVFKKDKIKRYPWPLRFPSWNLNLFMTFQICILP